MEAAKEAINKLTAHHGHHTTEVTEHYKPAVTHENVARTREHEGTTVIDKEIHQDHHHTTVLPVQHKEVLPTEHSHKLAAAQHSEHHHGDHRSIQDKIATEAASFKDRREVGAVETSQSEAPTIAGEHHHHHVHETIQPIIQKQTIQPSVVHTTVPVHEVHHNEPKHYSASALPAVSLAEFKNQGGSLTGIADRVERFEGEPESIARRGEHTGHGMSTASSGLNDSSRSGMTGTTGTSATSSTAAGTRTTGTGTGTGVTGTGIGNETSRSQRGLDSGVDNTTYGRTGTTGTSGIGNQTSRAEQALDSRIDNTTHGRSGTTGTTGTGGIGNQTSRAQQAIDSRVDGATHGRAGTAGTTGTSGLGSTGIGSTGTGSTGIGSTGTHSTNLRDSSLSNTSSSTHTEGKPSLLQKLNPFKDSDGDGKKGFMS